MLRKEEHKNNGELILRKNYNLPSYQSNIFSLPLKRIATNKNELETLTRSNNRGKKKKVQNINKNSKTKLE